jgi:glycine oxidase
MNDLSGLSVTIAGAGVLGLASALRLAERGARVVLCDPARAADNASGVAAGMLAPAFEAVLDGGEAPRPDLLLAARGRWPALLEAIGMAPDAIDRLGAVMAGREDEAGDAEVLEARFRSLGLAVERLTGAQVRELQPGAAPDLAWGLHSPDDWRLEPAAIMAALAGAFERAGGRTVRASLTGGEGGWRLEGAPQADLTLVATGADAAAFAGWAPELAALQPIKGQIVHFDGVVRDGAVLRDRRGYVTPQASGAIAGATMEAGRRDRDLDPEVLARLRANAAGLAPALGSAPARGLAGVRGATPDGLPLVGRAGADGRLLLAAGARRNGWLLAPLVAETIADIAAGGEGGPYAAALRPGRFA